MELRKLSTEGVVEALTTMLLLLCFTLLGLVLLYLIQPDIFTPFINAIEEYFGTITNYFSG